MLRVYKYQLPVGPGESAIDMPLNAEVLAVRAVEPHNGFYIGIWARVDPDHAVVRRHFTVVETGKKAPPTQYFGSAFFANGVYILHVFDGS